MESAGEQSVQTRMLTIDGADIVYDYEGSGPVLLTIAARGGTGGRYAGLSTILKTDYTVVRYDRRCCGRSSGDKSRPMDLTQQARDAVAVLRDMGAGQAYILGNSAGASIALKLAEVYPEVVLGMIVHEPVTICILDDRDVLVQFNRKADDLYHREGAGAAGKLLATRMVGMPQSPPPGNRPARGDDADFFLSNEFMSLCYQWPDFDRIKRNGVKLSASKGALSGDAFYARSADAVAAGVGCPVYTLSGNHIAYTTDPATFAAELRPILVELQNRKSSQAEELRGIS
jgi:pimeloyl-ACP methyl ester carboxylesterase